MLPARFFTLALTGLAIISASNAPCFSNDIDKRLERQSGRIGDAHSKRKMSSDQQVRADEADYRVQDMENRMRTKHKGKLTRRDRAKLNRMLNRNNRRINRDVRSN